MEINIADTKLCCCCGDKSPQQSMQPYTICSKSYAKPSVGFDHTDFMKQSSVPSII